MRVDSDRVIALFAVTVGGATSGCITATPGYFAAMKTVCRKHRALSILMAWEQGDVDASPDVMTIGKGLGGGYSPIAGILVHEDIIEPGGQGTGCFNH